jgi:hypothetical protein
VSAFKSLRDGDTPLLDESVDERSERVRQQVSNPYQTTAGVIGHYLKRCVVVSGPPVNDRAHQTTRVIVDRDDALAHDFAVRKGNEPGVAYESHVDDELPSESRVNGTDVAEASQTSSADASSGALCELMPSRASKLW